MPRRAAQRASGAVDEPNVILPLASSYNERGVAGYTHTVTNSEDQRKINCLYEIVKNSATGKGTLSLCKRNGVTDSGNTFETAAIDSTYLILNSLVDPAASHRILFGVSGTTSRSYAAASHLNIDTDSAVPAFADITSLSTIKNIVVQTRGIGLNKVFFGVASNIASNIVGWTQITDPQFPASIVGKMEHMDGFAFILDGSNQIWNSDINSLSSWTANNLLAKQMKEDTPIGLARLSNKLIAFGYDTFEVFYNAGNTTGSPLGRIPQLHRKIGLAMTVLFGGTNYYAILNERIYFCGRQSGGESSIGFYTFNGQDCIKVSNAYIDKILSENVLTIYSVMSIGVNGKSGIAIGLSAIDATPQRSLVFFPEWNEWFEWTSTVFSPINDGQFHIGFGSNKAKIFSFTSADNWQDAGTSYPWSTQFKLPTNGSSTKFMPMYGVDADTDTSTNDLTVEISTTDPQSFSTLGTIDQTQNRKVLFEGGSFTKAWIRLGNTNARPSRIHNWLARIE